MQHTRHLLVPCVAVLLAAVVGCGPAVDTAVAPGPSGPPWFEDIAAQRGLDFIHDAGPTGAYFMPQIMGSGCALIDYDGDGRLDIYLINNGGPRGARNRLFHQQPDGTFRDVSAGSGLDVAGYGMGAAVGDVNNDGRPDLLLTEYGATRLFLNDGGGKFRDVTRDADIDNPSWGTSAAFFDYDRDGWLDLVVVNYVDYNPVQRCGSQGGRPDYCHPNMFVGSVARLFHNRGPSAGGVRFEDVTVRAGLAGRPSNGLGVICYDFDGDGWPDIFAANDSKPNHLWINRRDGTFREEAAPRGVACNGLGQSAANMGVALGDLDGDGLPDLFVTHLTDETHTLWKQSPRGFFQDRTVAAGVTAGGWRGTGFGTVLADFNHDGWLDLAFVNGRVARRQEGQVAGHDFWAPYAERNQLFANDGRGRLYDISADTPALCSKPAVARALAAGDIDNDGALDLLVTEVAGPARLLRNVAPNSGNWLQVRAIDPKCKRDAYGAEVTVRAGGRTWLGWINPAGSYLASGDPRAHFGLGTAERIETLHVLWPDGTAEAFPPQEINRIVEVRKGAGTPVKGPGAAKP